MKQKIFSLVTLVITMILFSSCSEDDEVEIIEYNGIKMQSFTNDMGIEYGSCYRVGTRVTLSFYLVNKTGSVKEVFFGGAPNTAFYGPDGEKYEVARGSIGDEDFYKTLRAVDTIPANGKIRVSCEVLGVESKIDVFSSIVLSIYYRPEGSGIDDKSKVTFWNIPIE